MVYILKENRENPEPRLKNHREHPLQINQWLCKWRVTNHV
jgi:hypothetical protein